MGRKLSKTEEGELKRKGSLIVLDESDSQAFMTYHDPETGQEFPRLPADQYHLVMYITEKNWRPGPAPEHLRAKWEAGREEREREYEARLEATKKSKEFQELRNQTESISRSEVKQIVEETMLSVLRKVGLIPAEPEPEEEPETQSPYKESGATPESDTKLMVSQAPLDEEVQDEGN